MYETRALLIDWERSWLNRSGARLPPTELFQKYGLLSCVPLEGLAKGGHTFFFRG